MYLKFDIMGAILNNNSYFQGATTNFSKVDAKGYELIDHAYDLLKNNNEYYLSDVISNLRKAVNYRISTLFERLGIDNLQFDNLGKNRKLEKLEQLDIVKPLLINKLLEIRNGIEYNGTTPPSQKECEELIDIVWYFYRSTDRYCNKDPDSFLIEFNDSDNFLDLTFDFRYHKTLNIYGRLSPDCFSMQKIDGPIFIHNYKETNSTVSKAGAHSISFSCELQVLDLDNYFDIYSIVLYEWGNFL